MSRAAIISITRRRGPMAAKNIAAALRMRPDSIRASLRRARVHGSKFIRIAGWSGGVPMYGPGPDPDLIGGTTADLIVQHLEEFGKATAAQLRRELGLSEHRIDPAIRRLRKKYPGSLHIAGYERRRRRGGREAAIYAAGPGRDAPKPRRLDGRPSTARTAPPRCERPPA